MRIIDKPASYSYYMELGNSFLKLRKYYLAIEAFEEAESYAPSKEDAIKALFKRGMSERLKGGWQDSLKTFDLATKKAYDLRSGYSDQVAKIKREIAIVLMMMPNDDLNYETLDKAIKHLEESYCILSQTSYNVQAAISQELLGVALFMKGRIFKDNAIAMVEEAGKTIFQSVASSDSEKLDNLLWLAMISANHRFRFFFQIIRLVTNVYPNNYSKTLRTIFLVIRGNWINEKFRDDSEK